MKKKLKKKSRFLNLLEYAAVYLLMLITRAAPLAAIRLVSSILGDLLFYSGRKRRDIAIENLQNAFKGEKTEEEIKLIARQSCREFLFTFMETFKLRYLFIKDNAGNRDATIQRLINLFKKAKDIHDKAGGCIFVAPHLGSWEALPHICSAAGIPLVIIARPLDNELLHKLIYSDRTSTGQVIIPKKNPLLTLKQTLRQGKSVGILPDQSTMKGLLVDFFGRKATTTPIPAILAVKFKKPVVVGACCRKQGNYRYEGFVSDPIWPGEYTDEKAEIIRITEEINRSMESIIRQYPQQYLWMHNRWKRYKGKKEFMSSINPPTV